MSEIAKRLRDRRQNVWEQAKELADTAAEDNRAFSAEEQGSWDALNEELDKLDARIKAVLDGEERSKKADEAFERIAGKPVEKRVDGGEAGGAERDLDAKFRALGRGEVRNVEVGLPTGFERRALLEQRTVLTSNVPMPTTFIGQLYQYLVDTSSIRQANPTVYTTQTGENLTIPRSTAEGNATWTAEGAPLTAVDPTISSVSLGAYKVAKVMYVSSELLQDTGFDLLGFIAEHAGRNIGIAVDTAYVKGAGGTQPTGITSSITNNVSLGTGSTAGFVGTTPADFMFDLYHSVIPQYRGRASWLMNDATVKVVRKFKDSTNQYIWQPGLQVGQPDTLLGRPVYADPNVDQFGATARKVVLFGDFGGYWIRDVSPLRFDRSDDFKFDTDVVSFRILYRTDGKLGDTQAVAALVTLT